MPQIAQWPVQSRQSPRQAARLARDNPLADGLAFALFNDSDSGAAQSQYGRRVATPSGVSSVLTDRGRAITVNGTTNGNEGLIYTPAWFNIADLKAVIARVRWDGGTANTQQRIWYASDGTLTAQLVLQLSNPGTGRTTTFEGYIWSGTPLGTDRPDAPDLTVASGVDYHVAIIYTYSGSNDVTAQRYVIDGEEVAKFGNAGSLALSGTGVAVGNRYGGARPFQGRIYEVLAYTRTPSLKEIRELRRNPRQVIEPIGRTLFFASSGGAAALEAAPTISVTAAASLTTAIQVLGAAVVQAAAAGDLASAIQLAGAAQAGASATGDLLTSIDLAGAAVSATLASGDLSAQIRLDGAALASALAAAGLTTSIDLAGDAAGAVQAGGDITTVIRLSGDAVAAVLATGDLTAPGSGLEGHATAGASAAGGLTTQITLAGGATVSVIAAGDLATTISMAGAAVGIVSATGDLVIALALSGDAIAAALAGASLTTSISMLGAAVATAQAGGTLAGTVYKASARRTHVAARRIRAHVAPDRHRTYMAPRRVRNAIAGLQ